jgi:L-asparaginase II
MVTDSKTLQLLLPHSGDFVEVAELWRDGVVESRHRGIAALTSPTGDVLAAKGSAKRLIYPRSAVKPLQVVAMQRAGLAARPELLAIAAASHYGTAEHVSLVSELLASVGLTDTALQCPTAWPSSQMARATASEPSRLTFNCSGKHAGFLATCVAAGWPTDNYLDPASPIQGLVAQVLEEYSGEPILKSTTDGCGAPLHMMTVAGLARAFGRLAANRDPVIAAMLANPWIVGDHSTPDAAFLRQGFLAKLGAEGVFAVATPDGHGVAVKIADGSLRAAGLVALKMLEDAKLVDAAARDAIAQDLEVASMGGPQALGTLQAL